ncbi:DUF2867 domain-containing protein [Stenotrophomonas oahuensis]|uniref:DUF2867 domain-containing protein n=1 Tax=Stenotrophomonas oahuensis TaxID=3003271 RepID=A0ABY9YK56_9GAMM|nr:DUF2867 domain-containing protein [Stenotrophomonas sp. A5586]WNH51265.1 DUF2867 domain-containing protein [Stenotrophomonas sp. A5586]
MPGVTRMDRSFPGISLPSQGGGSPVEVTLITQLGIGAGDQLVRDAGVRQSAHPSFIDALDEPSARLGGMHMAQQDPSSLYSFAVGPQGHPFHRHAGPRMFTAVSGSGGAQLRFSTASDAQLEADPAAFLHALRFIDVPPDCLFTVRFGSGTWHQFVSKRAPHPALFALSCHANDHTGPLSEAQRARVEADNADIPSLTDTLPPHLQALLAQTDPHSVPSVSLSLHAPARSWAGRLCAATRDPIGRLRTALHGLRPIRGYVSRPPQRHPVTHHRGAPQDSLLQPQLPEGWHHQDYVSLTLPAHALPGRSARRTLETVLDGFMLNPPAGVGQLMAVRNVLVAPLRLRTSPLGCPVSSLLSEDRSQVFAGRFPVLGQQVDSEDRSAEVLLGADDRHLRFRSCVRVERLDDGQVRVSLGTRVRTHNAFGRFYMAMIDRTHRRYISPALLRMAVAHALAPELTGVSGAATQGVALRGIVGVR